MPRLHSQCPRQQPPSLVAMPGELQMLPSSFAHGAASHHDPLRHPANVDIDFNFFQNERYPGSCSGKRCEQALVHPSIRVIAHTGAYPLLMLPIEGFDGLLGVFSLLLLPIDGF